MNGKQLLDYILRKRPEYALCHKPLVDTLANMGHQSGVYTSFGPVYQIYMYAFFLGFHKGGRLPMPDSKSERKEFYELDKWSPKGMVHYILMMIMCNSKQELGLEHWADVEDLEEVEVKVFADEIVKAIEEYANGGFILLGEYYQRNKHEFEDPFVFMKLLKSVVDKGNNKVTPVKEALLEDAI
jgi:hypothetical protein